MNILLLDDHDLFRSGLRLLLTDFEDGAEYVEASTCAEVLKPGSRVDYDLVLMDFHMPGSTGLEALALIRERISDAFIVVLSGDESPAVIRSCIEGGAAGYIPKTSTHAVMMAALRLVLAGGVYLPAPFLHGLSTRAEAAPTDSRTPASIPVLPERQSQVLRLAIRGLCNKTIAQQMGLSEATIKAHLSSIYRSLGVRNRTEAVYEAARRGIR